MTPSETRAAIKRLGLTQIGLCRHIEALSGEPITPRTVQRWVCDQGAPPAAAALLALMERNTESWRS